MLRIRSFSLTILVYFVTFISFAQTHWESIVLENDQFRYSIPTTNQNLDWTALNYDDSGWSFGNGGFGFGDRDDWTRIDRNTTSLLLRKKISIPAGISMKTLFLDIDFDDAFVAYINGTEVARSGNLLPGIPSNVGSITDEHEAQMYSGGYPDRFKIDPANLVSGQNILAVHILNFEGSSDMSSRIYLNTEIEGTQIYFQQTPGWFNVPVDFTDSDLPIIRINTQGQTIRDDPRIIAQMQVISAPTGRNHVNDTSFDYNGNISIEVRGFTSQQFPKKNFGFETINADSSNNNVSLLGLPKENDWVLHGPYTDKSLMRNSLAYHLGNKMGLGWHPRTRYVELMINENYWGVYMLTEKIKIDKNRVDIAKLNPEDTVGDQLTGGYVISIDRDQYGSWNSPFMGRTGSVDVPFSYVDPKYDELLPSQRDYIREYITDFEYALDGEDFKDPEKGYRAYIDVLSFVDYFLITELSRDLDGYRVSVFFHKDKDSKDGKLSMTPFWDYNICFGNGNFFSAENPEGWTATGIGRGDAYEVPFWWDKFRSDPYFEAMIRHRWTELREDVLSKAAIDHYIDSTATILNEAQERNFQRWNVLNTWIWPNPYVGGTYENELLYLKGWIGARIDWLDGQISSFDSVQFTLPKVSSQTATAIYANSVELSGLIHDEGGTNVWSGGVYLSDEPDASNTGKRIKLRISEGAFAGMISGLKPNTKYYHQAFCQNDLGEVVGQELSFITPASVGSVPVVFTNVASDVSFRSAVVNGSIVFKGNSELIEKGFFWSEKPAVFGTGQKQTIDPESTDMLAKLRGLSAEKVYYYQAYALNESGYGLGQEHTFKTSEWLALADVITMNAQITSESSAVLGGSVTEDAGVAVTERGIYLSTVPVPEINGDKIVGTGSGKGIFIVNVSDLIIDQKYFAVAYATNATGTAFGDAVTFMIESEKVILENNSYSINEISVFPNPFDDHLDIKVSVPFKSEVTINISNMLGQEISEMAVMCNAGINLMRFDRIENMKSGQLYFYSIALEGKVIKTGKLIRR